MSQLALADFLPDFGGAPARAIPLEIAAPVAAPAPPAAPQPDIEALVAAELATAEARLRADMNEATETALNLERARHEVQLAETQAALGSEAGAKIAAAVEAAESRLASIANATAARILSSFLSDELARRSVDQLAARIRQALADRDAVRITVAGPQSLLESLEGALGPLAESCDFTEAASFDVSVSIDGALFETRLAEWAGEIGEALA